MAVKVSKPGHRAEYILRDDRESELKTVFELGPLTQEEIGQFNEMSPQTPEQSLKLAVVVAPSISEGRQLNDEELERIQKIVPDAHSPKHANALLRQYGYAVRRGLKRIRGLLDDEGNPQEMDAETFVKCADRNSVIELGIEILRISQLDRVQIKK